MDQQAVLEQALATTETIIRAIDADALERPTPCAGWNLRDLLNHLIGQLSVFEGNLADTEPRHPAPPGGLPGTDLVGDDPSHAYRQVAQPVLDASRQPGSHDRAGLGFGAYTTDVVVHGWDLATATGQDAPFDAEVAQWCLDFVRMGITDDNRAPAFGPQRAVSTDASSLDQLVAYLGRDPGS